MASGPLRNVVDHLHRLTLSLDPDSATDGQLLERFIARRDEAAFAALVRRHGPMVHGVCRRVIGNLHDADDAFQATFFVLARKAEDVQPRDMIGNWLYGVAYRTALKARSVRARRRAVEKQVDEMPQLPAVEQELWLDLQPLLDQELNKLPAVYRTPVVLCDLEGQARKDVARQLGVPEGTLSSRLTRGRQLLAKRLGRRGVTLSAFALGATLTQYAAAATVPAALAATTAKTATLLAAGAGVVPASIALLMNATLKSLLLNKVTTLIALVVATVVGAGVVATRSPSPPESLPTPTAQLSKPTPTVPTDEDRLQGAWDVVKLETEGRPVHLPPELREQAVTFRNGTVRTAFSPPDDGDAFMATFKLGPARLPRTIDVLVAGEQRSTGIYQLEDGTLTICLAPSGCDRPTEFKTTPEVPAILFVLKPAAVRG